MLGLPLEVDRVLIVELAVVAELDLLDRDVDGLRFGDVTGGPSRAVPAWWPRVSMVRVWVASPQFSVTWMAQPSPLVSQALIASQGSPLLGSYAQRQRRGDHEQMPGHDLKQK